jgi:hypothetical protein
MRMHKTLVIFALLLAVVLIAWGSVHWIARHEEGAAVVFFVGVIAAIAGALYYNKIRKNPPIK